MVQQHLDHRILKKPPGEWSEAFLAIQTQRANSKPLRSRFLLEALRHNPGKLNPDCFPA